MPKITDSGMALLVVSPVIQARFWAKYEKAPSGCLLWKGYLSVGGYGRFSMSDGERCLSVMAHRGAYVLNRGPIPVGLELDHLCRIRACGNWDHLEPVTGKENSHRGMAPRMKLWRARKCLNGHSLEGNQLRSGHCRICERARHQAWRAMRKNRHAAQG
jgi:hypothetical protein